MSNTLNLRPWDVLEDDEVLGGGTIPDDVQQNTLRLPDFYASSDEMMVLIEFYTTGLGSDTDILEIPENLQQVIGQAREEILRKRREEEEL